MNADAIAARERALRRSGAWATVFDSCLGSPAALVATAPVAEPIGMSTSDADIRNPEILIRRAQGCALVALPILWLVMLALHFRALADFFTLRLQYAPPLPAATVGRLIAAHNRAPLMHDQHLIGYLSLPLLMLAAFGLYRLGRRTRPLIAAIGLCLTVTGTIYLGGVFGLFTALMRGLGSVDPAQAVGAAAAYAAATAPTGNDAYALTRLLAELSMPGLALQALALWRTTGIPRHSTLLVVCGCVLFAAFWDIDNLMFAGGVCLAAGLWPYSRALLLPARGRD